MEDNKKMVNEKELDRIYADEVSETIRKFINKHYCWEDKKTNCCKICGERIVWE